jgi:hypothetical protein
MSEFVYLFRVSPGEQRQVLGTPEQAAYSMKVWLDWIRDLETKGHLKDLGRPLAAEGKVIRGGQRTVLDGPYIEVKDMVAGFIVVEARDLAHAIELASDCPLLDGEGSVEVRPVRQMPA